MDTCSIRVHCICRRCVCKDVLQVRTVIGHGSSIQGSHKVHGAPLGATDLAHVKTQYGFNPDESFVVPDDVREVYTSRSGATFDEWVTLFAAYSSAHPYLAGEFGRRMKGELPADWKDALPRFPVEEVSARIQSGREIQCVI